MKCPYCSFEESKVVDSRSADDGERIRRRRECLKCGKRFTTYEIIENIPLYVVKRDKSREVFDRNKLTAGILRACEKRPVSVEQVEEMVTDIELTAQNGFEREITAEQIGELVMERLKKVDEVSYVRFASVYRQFKDINTFMEELNKLLTEKKKYFKSLIIQKNQALFVYQVGIFKIIVKNLKILFILLRNNVIIILSLWLIALGLIVK